VRDGALALRRGTRPMTRVTEPTVVDCDRKTIPGRFSTPSNREDRAG
jgi:hypothetical protein